MKIVVNEETEGLVRFYNPNDVWQTLSVYPTDCLVLKENGSIWFYSTISGNYFLQISPHNPIWNHVLQFAEFEYDD